MSTNMVLYTRTSVSLLENIQSNLLSTVFNNNVYILMFMYIEREICYISYIIVELKSGKISLRYRYSL